MVGQGASVTVGAVALGRFVLAPEFPVADIFGAGVGIVAPHFVSHAITVIVDPVANLSRRNARVAERWRRSTLDAKQLTTTRAIFVAH